MVLKYYIFVYQQLILKKILQNNYFNVHILQKGQEKEIGPFKKINKNNKAKYLHLTLFVNIFINIALSIFVIVSLSIEKI